MRRGVRGAALAVVAAVSTGCTLFGPGPRDTADWHTGTPADLVAWLAGDLARESFPDSDPLRVPRAPLVERLDDGSWRVFASRAHESNGRVRANGRLVAGDFRTPGVETSVVRGWAPHLNFVPTLELGAFAGRHGFDVRIDTDEDGRTRVRAKAWGSAVEAVGRLESMVEMLDELHDVDEATTPIEGKIGRLQALLGKAHRLGAGRGPTFQRLLALPESRLGVLQARLGLLHDARAAFRRALDHDPAFDAARSRLAALDVRSARPDDGSGQLQRLSRSGPGLSAMLAAKRLTEIRETFGTQASTSTAPQSRERAEHALASGDYDAARAWSVRAASQATLTGRDLDLWSALLRGEGASPLALVLDLEALSADSPPETLLEVCERAIELGDDFLALRLLAEHWPNLRATAEHRVAADVLLGDLGQRLGTEIAARVLFAGTHDTALTARSLRRLIRTGHGSESGISLFARIEQLRSRAEGERDASSVLRPDGGWVLAPGVTPAR